MSEKQTIRIGDVVTAEDSFSYEDVNGIFWRVTGQAHLTDKVAKGAGGYFTLESIPTGRKVEALGIHLTAWNTRHDSEEVERLNQEIDKLRYRLECAEQTNATL